MTYGDVVMRFFYEQVPAFPVAPEVKFEAISAAVFGTKQRRMGPMPPPEVQVGVRDVIRHAMFEGNGVLKVFAPWGASKQADGAPLDVLEFMALKQLACMREELARFGLKTEFSFRLENLTDMVLFGDGRVNQINRYVESFYALAKTVLPGAKVNKESFFVDWSDFKYRTDVLTTAFYRVLKDIDPPEKLDEYGWKGGIPKSQADYYLQTYRHLYPGEDHEMILAKYLAAALARKTMGATATPKDPFLFVTFAHAVPNDPVRNNRLYFRTLPEKYTHQHFAPWLTNGYLKVSSEGVCAPRYVSADKMEGRLTEYTADLDGAKVFAPYSEE